MSRSKKLVALGKKNFFAKRTGADKPNDSDLIMPPESPCPTMKDGDEDGFQQFNTNIFGPAKLMPVMGVQPSSKAKVVKWLQSTGNENCLLASGPSKEDGTPSNKIVTPTNRVPAKDKAPSRAINTPDEVQMSDKLQNDVISPDMISVPQNKSTSVVEAFMGDQKTAVKCKAQRNLFPSDPNCVVLNDNPFLELMANYETPNGEFSDSEGPSIEDATPSNKIITLTNRVLAKDNAPPRATNTPDKLQNDVISPDKISVPQNKSTSVVEAFMEDQKTAIKHKALRNLFPSDPMLNDNPFLELMSNSETPMGEFSDNEDFIPDGSPGKVLTELQSAALWATDDVSFEFADDVLLSADECMEVAGEVLLPADEPMEIADEAVLSNEDMEQYQNLGHEADDIPEEVVDLQDQDVNDGGSGGESPKPRRRNPALWKRNLAKENKSKQPRDVLAPCALSCTRKCSERITQEQRQSINQRYWSIKDTSRQWDFISRFVKVAPVARRTTRDYDKEPLRQFSKKYYFPISDVENVQVCQVMFLKTLNISAMRVRLAVQKMVNRGGVISPDKRGKNGKKKTTHPSTIASVINHIKSFPTVESHYTRRRSKKMYLDEKLSVRRMFRLYQLGRGGRPHTATQRQYEDIFRREFKHKLSFYKPKKDQCGRCLSWKNKTAEEKEALREEQESHIANKKRAREIKDGFIKEALNNKEICVATYDLQKVFFCPFGDSGEYIFRRKLRCYNLSIFQSVLKTGYCYVWDETCGKKGSDEVSSCVLSFIKTKVDEGYKEFHFFSDNCWSQNKNGPLFSMYNMASCKFNVKISHSYLEKGHTQMECDSIHALIERRCRSATLCSPAAWYGVIRTAKVSRPAYVVKVMTQTDLFDFKAVLKLQNWSQVPKSTIREIKIEKHVAVYRKVFDGEETTVSLKPKRVGKPINWLTYSPPQKYSARILLKAAQLQDLIWLCDNSHIPQPDSQFFYDLQREQLAAQEDENAEASVSDNDNSAYEHDSDSD